MTGLEVTRADVVTLLLGRGLDLVERNAKAPTKPAVRRRPRSRLAEVTSTAFFRSVGV
jgi:hypothetical protein